MKSRIIKKGTIVKVVLTCIAGAGLITMATLAPNAIRSLSMFGIGKKKYNANSYLKTVVGKLHKKGLIYFREDGENKYIELTPQGEKLLAQYEATDIIINNQNKIWDGKWRVVMFDIKEYSRFARRQLRDTLIKIGFVRVQNSVWIFPYDCEEFIFLLKTNFELGKSVLFMTVEKLENDSWLKKEFGLQ
ncbi:MAG: CRISPR-associated endonuclease Cas2 [Patescibacteria group bacterium]